jgi:hypothetical protein
MSYSSFQSQTPLDQDFICKAGALNEANFINGLNNKGFTDQHCLGELVANSIDANAKNIKFKITEFSISQIDDGLGMSAETLSNMFEIHRENHKYNARMGRSGIGGKAATKILSRDTPIHVFTRMANSDYLCAVVPWDVIVETGVYTSAVTIRLMTAHEIQMFDDDRIYFTNTTGTTIKFCYDDDLDYQILSNFCDSSIKICERLAFIFGAFDVNIYYADFNKPNLDSKMKMYNYFGDHQSKYYTGIHVDTINHFKDEKGKDRFILTKVDDSDNETYYEVKTQGTCFKKTAEVCKINKNRLKYIGDFTVYSGMRIQKNYFDINAPVLPKTAGKIVHDYDSKFINNKLDDSAETLAKVGLRRNGQLISYFELPDCKIGSARGNVDSMHSTYHVRCITSYEVASSNNNDTDKVIGIQENKNQYQSSTLPINFTRLIKFIKYQTAKGIWDYFEEVVRAATPIGQGEVVDTSIQVNQTTTTSTNKKTKKTKPTGSETASVESTLTNQDESVTSVIQKDVLDYFKNATIAGASAGVNESSCGGGTSARETSCGGGYTKANPLDEAQERKPTYISKEKIAVIIGLLAKKVESSEDAIDDSDNNIKRWLVETDKLFNLLQPEIDKYY